MTRPRTLVALAIVGIAVGACLAPLPPSVAPVPQLSATPSASLAPARSAAAATPTPDPTPAPGQETELANPWMPPWSGPDAPVEIAERAGHRFCGVEVGPGAVDRAVRSCFLAAVADGRDIEFARIEFTIEGEPIATIHGYEVVEPPAFVVLTGTTPDAFGNHGWAVSTCSGIVDDPAEVFRFTGCVDGPTFR